MVKPADGPPPADTAGDFPGKRRCPVKPLRLLLPLLLWLFCCTAPLAAAALAGELYPSCPPPAGPAVSTGCWQAVILVVALALGVVAASCLGNRRRHGRPQ